MPLGSIREQLHMNACKMVLLLITFGERQSEHVAAKSIYYLGIAEHSLYMSIWLIIW